MIVSRNPKLPYDLDFNIFMNSQNDTIELMVKSVLYELMNHDEIRYRLNKHVFSNGTTLSVFIDNSNDGNKLIKTEVFGSASTSVPLIYINNDAIELLYDQMGKKDGSIVTYDELLRSVIAHELCHIFQEPSSDFLQMENDCDIYMSNVLNNWERNPHDWLLHEKLFCSGDINKLMNFKSDVNGFNISNEPTFRCLFDGYSESSLKIYDTNDDELLEIAIMESNSYEINSILSMIFGIFQSKSINDDDVIFGTSIDGDELNLSMIIPFHDYDLLENIDNMVAIYFDSIAIVI